VYFTVTRSPDLRSLASRFFPEGCPGEGGLEGASVLDASAFDVIFVELSMLKVMVFPAGWAGGVLGVEGEEALDSRTVNVFAVASTETTSPMNVISDFECSGRSCSGLSGGVWANTGVAARARTARIAVHRSIVVNLHETAPRAVGYRGSSSAARPFHRQVSCQLLPVELPEGRTRFSGRSKRNFRRDGENPDKRTGIFRYPV
jgi:hypothetical protein